MARALEEIKEEDDLFTGEELKLFQSVAARFNFLAMDKADLLYSVRELMRKWLHPARKISLPSKELLVTQLRSPEWRVDISWTEPNSNIEVFSDEKVAGFVSTRKSTSVLIQCADPHCQCVL